MIFAYCYFQFSVQIQVWLDYKRIISSLEIRVFMRFCDVKSV